MNQKYINEIKDEVGKYMKALESKYERQCLEAKMRLEGYKDAKEDLEDFIGVAIARHAKSYFESQQGSNDSIISVTRENQQVLKILSKAINDKDDIDTGKAEGTRDDCHNILYKAAIDSIKILKD